jgi:hypothetical protein
MGRSKRGSLILLAVIRKALHGASLNFYNVDF